jgi:uncharacterized protein YggT (Ycf19 family)
MPIKVTCSKCQGVLHAPDDAGGKRGKCPTCGNVLSIPGGHGDSLIPPEPTLAPTPINTTPPHRQSATYGVTDERRNSFAPGLTGPAPAMPPAPEPRRMPAGRMPAQAEARQSGDPFTRTGPRPTAAEVDDLSRAWRKTRRGLGLVQVGYFFALLAVVIPAGLTIAEAAGAKLPDKPGVLQMEGVRMIDEIRYAALLIPAALGLLALTFGRLGATNAPRPSYARGSFALAGLASVVVILGVVAAVGITGTQLAAKEPLHLIAPEDPKGAVQHIGIGFAALFAPLAELYFLVALGRLGAGLRDDRLAARGTRVLFYLGGVFVIGAALSYFTAYYPDQTRSLIDGLTQKALEPLGDKRAFVAPGVTIAVAVLVWLILLRLVGAGRAAIYAWLDVNRG